ncbi:hypothetical protein MtrunA17_Chr8g0365651 [Medicago truncatula]|uniref:DUF1645 family protein n=1 Tax=Medicago truncatula TaxID=3880 RepID=A0A396GMG3_MEDTR|nr:uncharacterized protein LOC25501343 [Medicago truncatula]XP_039685054.1 uncharacterized protein LOC120577543 [Medicago truncatula]XP_039685055.1 uncharacterized protein LOC120577544 [Medicago truncatula]XP_039685056.1 uncharacterized protein LOC120577545 [Medicago truncatula]XP_039685057.1 uncharacterized protein LOC120577546 [Medicago truncatula]XP_039685058.1 uncharacterized protein LOC120577547 [Medicago truncatula]XP_039685059.1 uncharacterized protein LOC120577548 [Medicago truncatula
MQKTGSNNIEILRVQALSILCTPHPFLEFSGFAPIPDKVDSIRSRKQQIKNDTLFDFDGSSPVQDKVDPFCSTKQQIDNDAFLDFDGFSPAEDKDIYNRSKEQRQDNDEENIEEGEFSFACTKVRGLHIFADEIFENGKIRQIPHTFDQSLFIYPTSNNNVSHLRPPLKKIFIKNSVNRHSMLGGISKESQNESLQNMTMVEIKASNECYEKSNSTGSSNLWKFRQNMNLRSNSDHKDSLVLLNASDPKNSRKPKVENIVNKKRKDEKHKNGLSAYEKLYVSNKTRKDSNKRRSFLPYKRQLFGLFTNMNGLSRNLHPF